MVVGVRLHFSNKKNQHITSNAIDFMTAVRWIWFPCHAPFQRFKGHFNRIVSLIVLLLNCILCSPCENERLCVHLHDVLMRDPKVINAWHNNYNKGQGSCSGFPSPFSTLSFSEAKNSHEDRIIRNELACIIEYNEEKKNTTPSQREPGSGRFFVSPIWICVVN